MNQMDATTSVLHWKVKNATQVGIATSWENVLEIKKVWLHKKKIPENKKAAMLFKTYYPKKVVLI